MSLAARLAREGLAKRIRRIRLLIAQFDGQSIVENAVTALHDPRIADPARWNEGLIRQYQPWNLLLLVKWTFMWGAFSRSLRRISPNGFIDLVNRVHCLGEFERPVDFDSIRVFLKNLAFQQFWFQQRMDRAKMARPPILFSQMSDGVFDAAFVDAVGLPLEHFFDLGLALFSALGPSQGYRTTVDLNYFEPVFGVYGREEIRRFLGSLSLAVNEVRQFLQQQSQDTPPGILEIYEQTPLRRFPLFRRDDLYLEYAPSVLFDRLAHFPYDVLREQDPNKFGSTFGPIFEAYVRRILELLKRPVFSERYLQERSGTREKCVDCIVPYPNATVMVEAKGIELSAIARIHPRLDKIADSLRSTAVKAIGQAAMTAETLERLRNQGDPVTAAGPIYCLVVTYKRLYLGRAVDLLGAFSTRDREKLLRGVRLNDDLLPLRNIYFISIEDLEQAVALECNGASSLAESLRAAVDADSSARNKFEFGQHLDVLSPAANFPAPLTEEFERLSQRVLRRFETKTL